MKEIVSIVSVVCEFINWFIAKDIWGWFNERNGLYTAHSGFSVHIVHYVRTLHTVHIAHYVLILHTAHTAHNLRTVRSVHTEHTLYTAHTVHTVHTQLNTTDGINHVYQYMY
jgi:hypothetical protein